MEDEMMGADQTAGAAAEDSGDTDASKGYCIEIRVGADGKVSVGVESLADEQSEEAGTGEGAEGGEGSGDDDYQPVDSFIAAIKLAKEIYAHAGSMSDMSASQDEMNSGYSAKAGA